MESMESGAWSEAGLDDGLAITEAGQYVRAMADKPLRSGSMMPPPPSTALSCSAIPPPPRTSLSGSVIPPPPKTALPSCSAIPPPPSHGAGLLGRAAAAADRVAFVLGDPAAAGHRASLLLGRAAAAEHGAGGSAIPPPPSIAHLDQ